MNKKLNTAIFMIAGTILNIVLMLGLFIFFLYLGNLILTPDTANGLKMTVFFLIMVLSVGLSFFIYSRLIRFLSRKWNLEEHLHPIFSRGRKV